MNTQHSKLGIQQPKHGIHAAFNIQHLALTQLSTETFITHSTFGIIENIQL